MNSLVSASFILAISISICSAAKLPPVPVYSDVESATQAHADFPMLGEYVSNNGNTALQATLLKDGDFLVATYQGGLPGDGWDKKSIQSEKLTPGTVKALLKGYTKTERVSPTLGKAMPANAYLTFPADFTNVEDGLLLAGGKTNKDMGSFHMHIEFMQPFKPGRNPSSQDRGNSGIYLQGRYELQILDSFGLKPKHNECGGVYSIKKADANMCGAPLAWQTYDIDFTEAKYGEEGQLVEDPRMTVRHNGVIIHKDVELPMATASALMEPGPSPGPLYLQDHGSEVRFRNIWVVPKTEETVEKQNVVRSQ